MKEGDFVIYKYPYKNRLHLYKIIEIMSNSKIKIEHLIMHHIYEDCSDFWVVATEEQIANFIAEKMLK